MSAAATKAIVISTLLHSAVAVGLCASWSAKPAARTMTIAALYLTEGDDGSPNPLPAIIADPINEPSFNWPTIQPVVHQTEIATPGSVDQHSPSTPSIAVPEVTPKSTPTVHSTTSPRQGSMPITQMPGAVSFCGVATQASSVVFVIDCSASMGLHGRLQRALHEVENSLRQLPPTTKFQVIAYHRSAEPLRIDNKPGLMLAQPNAISSAISAMQQLRAEGSADHRRAINSALAMRPDVIYFLTDEDDFTSSAAFELTRANAGRTCIHTICLVAPTLIQSPLAQLASLNRGTFTVVDQ